MKGSAAVAMASFLFVACALEAETGEEIGKSSSALHVHKKAGAGACVSFQSVTCTVWYSDHQAECQANYGTWREDANCFDRDRDPILGCVFRDHTEWFFSHYAESTDAERETALETCLGAGGRIVRRHTDGA